MERERLHVLEGIQDLVESDLFLQTAGPNGIQHPQCAHPIHISCVLAEVKGQLQVI